jgi:hypothetical protein
MVESILQVIRVFEDENEWLHSQQSDVDDGYFCKGCGIYVEDKPSNYKIYRPTRYKEMMDRFFAVIK